MANICRRSEIKASDKTLQTDRVDTNLNSLTNERDHYYSWRSRVGMGWGLSSPAHWVTDLLKGKTRAGRGDGDRREDEGAGMRRVAMTGLEEEEEEEAEEGVTKWRHASLAGLDSSAILADAIMLGRMVRQETFFTRIVGGVAVSTFGVISRCYLGDTGFIPGSTLAGKCSTAIQDCNMHEV
jgi:hypothetical protein